MGPRLVAEAREGGSLPLSSSQRRASPGGKSARAFTPAKFTSKDYLKRCATAVAQPCR